MAEVKHYDLLIVGGGTAGMILAGKISERGVDPRTGGKLKIAVLEAGAYAKGEPKPGYGHPRRRQLFINLPQQRAKLGKDFVSWYGGGRGVGGSSLVMGSGAYFPFDGDYEDWQAETGVDWSKETFAPSIEEARQVFNVRESPPETLSHLRSAEMFKNVAASMGHSVKPAHTRNVKNCIFCGHCGSRQLCKYDAKLSTLVTHAPIAERNGVDIIPNARTEKLLIERSGGRPVVRGAIYRKLDLPDDIYPGDDYVDWDAAPSVTLLAEKVIVSCGYLETPPLLYASGYGPKEECGEDLIVENPNVGRNIDGHFGAGGQMGVTAVFDEEVRTDDSPWQVDPTYHFDTRVGSDRLLIFNGYLPPTHSFFTVRPEQIAQYPYAPQFGNEHKDFMRGISSPWHEPSRAENETRSMLRRLMRIHVVAKFPRSAPRGWIDRKGGIHLPNSREVLKYSSDTGKEERVYLDMHPEMRKLYVAGQEIAVSMLEKMGAKEILRDSIPATGGMHFKWISGGARAGTDPKNSVINQHFESHDVDNLFVVDVSSLPRSPTLVMYMTICPVSLFAADRIIARHFTRS